jgi:hypothetical protein
MGLLDRAAVAFSEKGQEGYWDTLSRGPRPQTTQFHETGETAHGETPEDPSSSSVSQLTVK